MKDETAPLDIKAMRTRFTWRFRGFLAGLVLSVSATGYGAYTIHPGLAIMVVSSAMAFFCHVNAKILDDTLIRLRQAEMLLATAPAAEVTNDVLKDYKPGGYR